MANILNTRPAHQSALLTQLLTAAGHHVYDLPLLAIHPVAFTPISPAESDWLIFTSQNAVHTFFSSINPAPFYANKIIAVGSATQNALHSLGFKSVLCPELFSSEGILSMNDMQNVTHQRIAIICGENPKPLLHNTLMQRGALINTIFCYQRKPIHHQMHLVFPDLQKNAIDIIIITSGENFSQLLNLFSHPLHRAWLLEKKLCVINTILFDAAIQAGFCFVIKADNATDEALLNAINSIK